MIMDTMKNIISTRLFRLGLPVTLLFCATFFIWLTDADLRLARAVYQPGLGWPGIDLFPWDLLYEYAGAPALIMAGLAGGILLASVFLKRLAGQRKPALFFLLVLAVGPGLLVNVLFKDHLGRARPRELVEFGGQYQFTQIWQPGNSGNNSSFPSGHASVAFYLLSPWFVLRRKKRPLAACWLAGGLGYGSLVGVARILQGGHFLSDVLWAGGLVYLSGEILVLVMRLDQDPAGTRES